MAFIILSASELPSIHFYEFPKIIQQACLEPKDGNNSYFYFKETDLSCCKLIDIEKMISGFEKTSVTFVNLSGTFFANSLDAFDLKHVLLAFKRTNVVDLDLTRCLPLQNLELLKSFKGLLPNIKKVYLEKIQDLSIEHQNSIRAIFPQAAIMIRFSELEVQPPVMYGGHFGAPRGVVPIPSRGAHLMEASRPSFGIPMRPPAVHFGAPPFGMMARKSSFTAHQPSRDEVRLVRKPHFLRVNSTLC
jgi:hypothetical protein